MGREGLFSFYDSEIKGFEDGSYVYGVEMTLTEPTKKVFKKRKCQVSQCLAIFCFNIIILLITRKYFNNQGKLNNHAICFFGKVYPNNAPWRRAVRIYLKVLKNLTGIADKSHVRHLYSLLAPTSRDFKWGGKFNFVTRRFDKEAFRRRASTIQRKQGIILDLLVTNRGIF